MPKICQAGITRTYKHRKAASTWPGYVTWRDDLPRCGGEVTFKVKVDGGGCCAGNDYCYCESPRLEITAVCSKCQDPWYEGMFDITRGDGPSILEGFLNG